MIIPIPVITIGDSAFCAVVLTGNILYAGMAKITIKTLGCKLNIADSQTIARQLTGAGHRIVKSVKDAEIYLLNSCTVTHIADRKARQTLAAVKRSNPSVQVVITGCYAQRAADELHGLNYIDKVIPNTAKKNIVDLLVGGQAHRTTTKTTKLALFGRSRAMVKIQEGCDQVCAYCIVPKVRGRERSVSAEEVVRTINRYLSIGCREVVLTGTQLGGYGFDLDGTNLTLLVTKILEETTVERLRVSSIQPQEFNVSLLGLWNDIGAGRLCPHFHIPLQSGSDRVLKTMRRRYNADRFHAAVNTVRDAVSGASVTTDIIAGFPGETDEEHADSLTMIERCEFADVHIFPYSRRAGTSADYMKSHLESSVIAKRAAELRSKGLFYAKKYRESLEGRIRPVLWEDGAGRSGLTDNYIRVFLRDGKGEDRLNKIESVKLGSYANGMVEATVIKS